MANSYQLRTAAELRTFGTIESTLKRIGEILREHADSPDLISGGVHIHPTIVIPGEEPIAWTRGYKAAEGQAPAPQDAQDNSFKPTHRLKKTGALYQFLFFVMHTEDDEPLAVYVDEKGVRRARPKEMFEDGRFEKLGEETAQ